MNVEMMGVEFVRLAISKTDYLVQNINDNDREPSWDGNVEVYRKAGDIHSKEDLTLKVPVQVKGHKENNLKKKSITYSVELSDLRNYLNVGGTTFLVVYVNEDGEKSQIYYNNLLPFELKRMINKYGHQKTKRITLKALPKNKNEIADIFLFAATHIKKQLPAISCDPVSMDELIKTGQVTSFSFGYTRVPGEKENPFDYLFDHETYIYAKLPWGLELPVEHLSQITVTGTTCDCPISVNGVQFYSEYQIEQRKDSFTVKLGKGIKSITKRNGDTNHLTFTPTGTLSERITDADFIIQAIEAECFMVGDVLCPLNINDKKELEKFKLDERKRQLQWLKVVKSLLDTLGVTCELDMDSVTDEDTEKLIKLAQSVLQGKFVEWDLKDNHFPEINIANIIVKLCVLEHEENKSLCRLFPYTDAPIGYHLKYASGEAADTSYHILLKKDSMLRCCNINFSQLVEKIKAYPITEELSGSLVWLLLEMLCAYDESGDKRDDILDAAIEFATWLKNTDKFTPQDLLDLNYCQTVARSKNLSDNDIKTLHSIIEANPIRKDVYVGTYLLLGDYVSAKKHYEDMEDGERKVFDDYPISRFWSKS